MPDSREIRVPDIGDFESIEVIDVLVSAGDTVAKDDSLITLESDKASMDIPCPAAGTVKSVHIKTGDRVSEGSLILILEKPASEKIKSSKTDVISTSDPVDATPGESDMHADVVVLGAGPGGYTAAFRAADLGKKTILVERYPTLGGVCLNVGCIPSKALLHVAKVITEIQELKTHGIDLGNGKTDHKAIRKWTETVVGKLTGGLTQMAKQRKVQVIQGTGKFSSANSINITNSGDQSRTITFDHAIIAAGSRPAMIPGVPDDPRILDSTSALKLESIPERLLVIGGGIIGLEMADVYFALGSKITVVEMMDSLISECDHDIVNPLQKRISKQYENIYLNTSVESVTAGKKTIEVTFTGKDAPEKDEFDAILVAVGRRSNGDRIGADKAGVYIDKMGLISVDDQQRTNVPHIYAIGDITGQPMLAHKASHEGKLAAEVIAGQRRGFDNRAIPSVAYTDPEVAWVGMTENEARSRNIDYGKGVFPWAASGRSLSLGRNEGLTKIIFEKDTHRIIGAAIVGPNAGDLIAECTLAIEMGADATDIGLTIHPHPTLSETVGFAAEMFEGTITDLYIPKK
jgi:dihydrolipoamide dehydrogenase